MGADFGTHHFLKSSGLVQASNTRCDGPLMMREETSSRSDFRSAFVWFFICFYSSVLIPGRHVQVRRSAGPRYFCILRSKPSRNLAGTNRACRSAPDLPSLSSRDRFVPKLRRAYSCLSASDETVQQVR